MRSWWAIGVVIAMLGGPVAAAGVAAADILPVATPTVGLGAFPYTVKSPSAVTLVIRQGGADKPDWLPEPDVPVQVVVKVNGAEVTTGYTIALVPPAIGVTFNGVINPFLNATALTTSAYPGQCSNTNNVAGRPLDYPDYELSSGPPYTLTPTDCGGFAVLDVSVPAAGGTFKFIVPQDGDPTYPVGDRRSANGIPAIWEQQFCTPTFPCPTGTEDDDAPPVTPVPATNKGDGAGVFDEYRGYMVPDPANPSGRLHLRTDPRQRDVFAFLVNPQCNAGGNGPPGAADQSLSLLGGGAFTLPVATPQTSGDVFEGFKALYGATQTHLLHRPGQSNYQGTDFWEDHFIKYTPSTGVVLDTSNPTFAVTDRQTNKYAVLSGNRIQRGIRFIECATATLPGAPGFASTGAVFDNTGYAIIYPQRIVQLVNCLIAGGTGCTAAGGGGRQLKHGTYTAGSRSLVKTTPVLSGDGNPANLAGQPPGPSAANIWASLYLQYVIAQEGLHVGDLIRNADTSLPGGGHTAEGTGYFLDITLSNQVSKTAGCCNTTYFPSGASAVSGNDKSTFVLTGP
jgi:hypothetical protein